MKKMFIVLLLAFGSCVMVSASNPQKMEQAKEIKGHLQNGDHEKALNAAGNSSLGGRTSGIRGQVENAMDKAIKEKRAKEKKDKEKK